MNETETKLKDWLVRALGALTDYHVAHDMRNCNYYCMCPACETHREVAVAFGKWRKESD